MAEEQPTEAQPAPEELSPEIAFEMNGGGFIPGYPGHYANCRVVFNRHTREFLRTESLMELPKPEPEEQKQEQAPIDPPVNQSQGG